MNQICCFPINNLKIHFILGARLGILIAKTGLIKFLADFDVEPLSHDELEYESFGFTMVVKGGIQLKITNRKK